MRFRAWTPKLPNIVNYCRCIRRNKKIIKVGMFWWVAKSLTPNNKVNNLWYPRGDSQTSTPTKLIQITSSSPHKLIRCSMSSKSQWKTRTIFNQISQECHNRGLVREEKMEMEMEKEIKDSVQSWVCGKVVNRSELRIQKVQKCKRISLRTTLVILLVATRLSLRCVRHTIRTPPKQIIAILLTMEKVREVVQEWALKS